MGQDTLSPGAFERFVLKYGYEFKEVIGLPASMPPGQPQRCFGNAALEAHCNPNEYAYVEGYAYQYGLIPIAHAWLIDRQGRVIDPTWNTSRPVEYFGVIFKHSYIKNKLGLSMIDNWQKKWPLLHMQQPSRHLHRLENWIKTPA